MKLFEIYINNGEKYEDEFHVTILKVAKSKSEIENFIENEKHDYSYLFHNYIINNTFYEIEELIEIDGYVIKLVKE